jgi:hypothetical protein
VYESILYGDSQVFELSCFLEGAICQSLLLLSLSSFERYISVFLGGYNHRAQFTLVNFQVRSSHFSLQRVHYVGSKVHHR